MPSIIVDNIPFPEDQLSDDRRNLALGRFMTAWSQVETTSMFLFRIGMDVDPDTGSAAFEHIETRQQIDILKELVGSVKDAEMRGKALGLVSEVKALGTRRNRITHGTWGYLGGEPARFYRGFNLTNFPAGPPDEEAERKMLQDRVLRYLRLRGLLKTH